MLDERCYLQTCKATTFERKNKNKTNVIFFDKF